MNTYTRLKTAISLIFIFVFVSAFMDKESQSIIPYENGMLNGLVEIKLPIIKNAKQSGGTLVGQYTQNQKVGSWKLYDKSHHLILERNYANNFEYSEGGETNRIPEDLKLKRDENGLYIYSEKIEKNIGAALRIWKHINIKQMDERSPIKIALLEMDLSGIRAYKSDALRKEVIDVNYTPPTKEIQIMGDWFYNKKLKRSEYRIVAISPVSMDNKHSVWYYFNDIRERLKEFNLVNENPLITNIDDLFYLGSYPYEVSKTESLENESYGEGKRHDKTINTIEQTLMLEAALW